MKQHNSGFLSIVNDAKNRVKEIRNSDLAEKLNKKTSFYLIDVRELEEYKKGALPNAIHLSKGTIERDIEARIPDHNAEIVVYCSGGFRSCLVADNLQKMGYKHVVSLAGGSRAWVEAGYPFKA